MTKGTMAGKRRGRQGAGREERKGAQVQEYGSFSPLLLTPENSPAELSAERNGSQQAAERTGEAWRRACSCMGLTLSSLLLPVQPRKCHCALDTALGPPCHLFGLLQSQG